MKVFAVSDCHVECAQNKRWLQGLPKFGPDTALIVAGDLGVTLTQVRWVLLLFKQRFEGGTTSAGTHRSLPARRPGRTPQSMTPRNQKARCLRASETTRTRSRSSGCLKQLCESICFHTSPQKVGGVWIVPVCSWYHFSWDREPSLDQLVNLPLDTQPSLALGPCGRPDIVQMA